MNSFGYLFTPRQALALTTLVRLVREAEQQCREVCDPGLAEAVATCLALVVDRVSDRLSTLARWDTSRDNVANTFSRQALPMVWDFAEANPFSNATGDFSGALEWVEKVCRTNVSTARYAATSQLASATKHPLPDDAAHAFVTDPPYYDAVPYADLSDFFYVWLRRTIGHLHPGLFANPITPKDDECIVDETKGLTAEKFEATMLAAMVEGRRVLAPDGIGVVVFAHKSTAGWEAMLQAMVDAGWVITASWPIDTEMGSRLRARNSAVLASSIHIVCRPRENPDGSLKENAVGEWRRVLRELPERIHAWMPRLAEEGVVGADAIFACLGPALEIFSRYARVEKASGEAVSLREYLEHVWAAVAREALSMIFDDPDTAGLEEDARLTAMWLWTLSAGRNGDGKGADENEKVRPGSFTLDFDAVRKIAQGLGVHLENLDGVVEIKGNKARLRSVSERTAFLSGEEGGPPAPIRRSKPKQLSLYPDGAEAEAAGGRFRTPRPGRTTLDRLHQAMLLFGAGRVEALRKFLVDEGVGRDTRFWKLAQALSALYPEGTEEKRWVDGLLAGKKGHGF